MRYADSVDDFLQWAQNKKIQVKSDRQADKAMAIYFDQVFEDGCPLTVASYTLFGYIVLRTIPDSGAGHVSA